MGSFSIPRHKNICWGLGRKSRPGWLRWRIPLTLILRKRMNQHMLLQGRSKLAEIWLSSVVLELLFGSTENKISKIPLPCQMLEELRIMWYKYWILHHKSGVVVDGILTYKYWPIYMDEERWPCNFSLGLYVDPQGPLPHAPSGDYNFFEHGPIFVDVPLHIPSCIKILQEPCTWGVSASTSPHTINSWKFLLR